MCVDLSPSCWTCISGTACRHQCHRLNQANSLALWCSLVPPWCPRWSFLRISGLMFTGTMIHYPFRTCPLCKLNLSQKLKYFCTFIESSWWCSCHLHWIYSKSSCRIWTWRVASAKLFSLSQDTVNSISYTTMSSHEAWSSVLGFINWERQIINLYLFTFDIHQLDLKTEIQRSTL